MALTAVTGEGFAMFRLTAACCTCLLASGCFSSPAVYPGHWRGQQVLNDGDCPVIDGSYLNAGETYRSADGDEHAIAEARSLAHLLNGGTGVESLALWNKLGDSHADPARDPAVTVDLVVLADRLRVTATHADGGSRSLALPLSDDCHDGLYALASDWDTDLELIAPVAPEFSRKSTSLGRADDGSLLVYEKKTAVQWYLLTPAFGYSEAAWIRFSPAPPPAARPNSAASPTPSRADCSRSRRTSCPERGAPR